MLEIPIILLETYNNMKNMKSGRKVLLMTSILVLTIIGGLIAYAVIDPDPGGNLFKGLNLLILILIIALAVIALVIAFRKDKEERSGFTIEDELSKLMKFKAGHDAYLASMYMWLFIFLFKDMFPDTESMLGGGILLSGLIGVISRQVVKHRFNEE